MARYGFIHDKLDIKFLILYLMARVVAPIDFPTLTDLTMCDGGVDYFEFAEAVNELVETGHLVLEGGRYAITDGGFTVELALDDDGGNLFSLSLFCTSRDQGERLCSGFQAKPERVYNEVLSALLDEYVFELVFFFFPMNGCPASSGSLCPCPATR